MTTREQAIEALTAIDMLMLTAIDGFDPERLASISDHLPCEIEHEIVKASVSIISDFCVQMARIYPEYTPLSVWQLVINSYRERVDQVAPPADNN